MEISIDNDHYTAFSCAQKIIFPVIYLFIPYLLFSTYLPLKIYVDGPYGAPAEHFFEAEHAVLISSGIGVTPFASILQTIMLKYKSASHMCPNCEHCWVGNVPFSLRKLQKV